MRAVLAQDGSSRQERRSKLNVRKRGYLKTESTGFTSA